MVARWRIFALAASLSLGACDTPPPTTAAPRFTKATAPGAKLDHQPLALEGVVIDVPAGTQVGWHRYYCRLCEPEVYVWGGRSTVARQDDFGASFVDALTAAGYRVVGDPRQIFDRRDTASSARFLVGAKINAMSFGLQQVNWAFSGFSTEGNAQMQVTWQIYSLAERRVVYQTGTSGEMSLHRQGLAATPLTLLQGAFADAVTKLAIDPKFQQAIATRDAAFEQAAFGNDIAVPRFKPFVGAATTRLAELPNSAVTIVFPHGHGSGFFISDDGMILTNQHVVGDAETVNVRLAGGVELVGRVLRRHTARDVALVKVDLGRTRPLPLRLEPLHVGEAVYALGAPLETRLAGSITRGIVSGFPRETRGGVQLDMIQSDAAIHGGNSGGPLLDTSGNVVGIAVSGHGVGNYNTGLNFFVPIEDALKHLNIRLGETR